MRAASQLSGSQGPLVWMLPLYLHVNQKSDYDYDDDEIDHEIFSTVILSLSLIQEGQLHFLAKECEQYWLKA